MESILNSEVYQQYKHRQDDVKELIYELIVAEDEDNRYSDLERECISQLNGFYQV